MLRDYKWSVGLTLIISAFWSVILNRMIQIERYRAMFSHMSSWRDNRSHVTDVTRRCCLQLFFAGYKHISIFLVCFDLFSGESSWSLQSIVILLKHISSTVAVSKVRKSCTLIARKKRRLVVIVHKSLQNRLYVSGPFQLSNVDNRPYHGFRRHFQLTSRQTRLK